MRKKSNGTARAGQPSSRVEINKSGQQTAAAAEHPASDRYWRGRTVQAGAAVADEDIRPCDARGTHPSTGHGASTGSRQNERTPTGRRTSRFGGPQSEDRRTYCSGQRRAGQRHHRSGFGRRGTPPRDGADCERRRGSRCRFPGNACRCQHHLRDACCRRANALTLARGGPKPCKA